MITDMFTPSVNLISTENKQQVGVVVIGRNEGKRLEICLRSVVGQCKAIVYVDSGSTDGSLEMARSLAGIEVVELDMSTPFSMSRGRNTGWEYLVKKYPSIEYIQFVDGDCEIRQGWMHTACIALLAHPDVAAVVGRLRERSPEASFYNRLADMDWRKSPGELKSFGGIVMIRVDALVKSGGYNPRMIAGEEAELSMRIRRLGYKIFCIEAEMCLHDIAMTRFSQWWMRCVRTGYAYAHGASLQRGEDENPNFRRLFSAIVWGIIVPMSLMVFVVLGLYHMAILPLGLIPLLLFGIIGFRTFRHQRSNGVSFPDSLLYATMILLSKIPQSLGIFKYVFLRVQGKYGRIIDYKKVVS